MRGKMKDAFYLQTALGVAEHSKCKRMKVGAVLVKKGDIIGTGYNGTPTKFEPDVCECQKTGETLDYVIHAELNAILSAARNGRSTKGSTLYLTLSPCSKCAALIMQAGIKKVVFLKRYRNTEALTLLSEYGIITTQY